MPIKLNGATNGSIELNVPDAVGSDLQMTLPATAGEIVVKDSSGKVGIGESSPANLLHVKASDTGVTPHASAQIVLERSGTNYLQLLTANTGTQGILFGDADDNDRGKVAYDHSNDSMRFEVAAGERLRIDSSGNVGIGENNPSMPLMIKSERTGGKNIFDLNNQKANHYGGLRVTLGETDRECRLTATYGSSFMSFFTAASTGAATERMRIDSAGIFLGNSSSTFNVFANTNPAAKMHLSGGGGGSANIEIHGASHASDAKVITFDTNSSERMRIDSSGRLLVGTTSPDGRLTINGETSGATSNAINVRNSAGQAMFTVRNDGRIATGGAGSPYNKTTGTGANAVFGSDGVFYRSTSSLKYKTNVQNASHGLQKVLALRPVTYEGTSEVDAGITFGGLIAEEVHDTGLTEFVQYAEDGSPDALAYGPMVSLCIKAIQEQQVVIAELQAEVADLKGQ